MKTTKRGGGRAPLLGESMVVASIAMTPGMLAELKEIAARGGMGISELVREAISNGLPIIRGEV